MNRSPWLPPTDTAAVLFALRTTLAAFVALYLAFLMSMDDPKWAAMTVWIVAQQDRGMSRSKAAYRAAGTVTGATVAVALIALWGQVPELLFFGLAVWIAGCVALATSQRNFQAYGAVLAGYTAAIIALNVSHTPGEVFSVALSRTVYILLGIVCEGVAAALFALSQPETDVRARLSALVVDAAKVCERALRGEMAAPRVDPSSSTPVTRPLGPASAGQAVAPAPAAPIGHEIRALFADALRLDTSASYAAAVSTNASGLVRTVRHIAGAVLEQLSASQALSDRLAKSSPHQRLLDAIAQAMAHAAHSLPYSVEQSRRDALLAELNALQHAIQAEERDSAFTDAIVLDRLRGLLGPTQVLAGIISQTSEHWRSRLTRAPARFSFVVDRKAALLNGLRAFVAIGLAALIWAISGWETGAGFVTITGVVCALFSTRPNPTSGSWAFFQGACVAAVVAGFCNFVLLPPGTGFAWLALILMPFLFIGGLALRNPSTAGAAAGFTIFVIDLIGPTNEGRGDPTAFFNGALTLCAGIAFGAIIFHLIAPSDAASVRRRLHRRIIRDLERIAIRPARWSRIAWLGRMADSVGRQASRAAGLPAEQIEADFRLTLAALDIGRSTMTLARLTDDVAVMYDPTDPDSTLDRRVMQRVSIVYLRRMANLSRHPAAAARAAHRGARRLALASQRTTATTATDAVGTPSSERKTRAVLRQAAYALQHAAEALNTHIVSREF